MLFVFLIITIIIIIFIIICKATWRFFEVSLIQKNTNNIKQSTKNDMLKLWVIIVNAYLHFIIARCCPEYTRCTSLVLSFHQIHDIPSNIWVTILMHCVIEHHSSVSTFAYYKLMTLIMKSTIMTSHANKNEWLPW